MVPDNLKYTTDHEWIAQVSEDVVRVGITHHAQQQLGDVVFVQLPEIGDEVSGGDAAGEVESTKSVSEIFAPISGEVVARNEQLEAAPELVNSDPYGAGWMLEIKIADVAQIEDLLAAQAYRDLIDAS